LAARSPRPATGTGRSPWSCVPSDPEHCYRPVLHRLAVEQSSDGGRTWRMAWSVSPGRQRFLTRGYPEAYGGVSDVASRAVGILPVGAGYLVVVADGRDGVLVRHPDGRWQRQGFPNSGSSDVVSGRSSVPLVQTGERIGPEYISSTLAASLGLLLGGLGARRRRKGTWLQVSVSTLVLVTGIGFVAAFGGISAWTWTTAIAVLLALALVAWAFMVVTLGAVSAWRAALLVILAGATVAAMMAPMIGWSAGAIDSYDTAVRTMPISAAAGIAIMAVVGLVLGRLPE
jgi:hypothetical protein